MKKLFKLLSGVSFVFLLILTISSFSSNVTTLVNNGGVEIIKDGVRCYQSFSCAGENCSEKQTLQYKNGVLHMRTTIYQLPQGHCDIPLRATKTIVNPNYWFIFTPSGKVIAKEVHN